MYHWLTIVGASLALAGALVLGIELWREKDDEAGDAAFQSDQNEIDGVVRETVINLRNVFSDQGEIVIGYLMALEEDIKPLFKPLLEDGENEEAKVKLAASILLRHKVLEDLAESQQKFASSTDPERAIMLVQEAQKRIVARFVKQEAIARNLRTLAKWGVVLVGAGAFAQLLDAVLHS